MALITYLMMVSTWEFGDLSPRNSNPLQPVKDALEMELNDVRNFCEFLDQKEILYHFEAQSYFSEEKGKTLVKDVALIHVYNEADAFTIRFENGLLPLDEAWQERFDSGDIRNLRWK